MATLPEVSASIDASALRAYVAALASDETEGRLTGTVGEQLATDYIARAFDAIGLEAAGDAGSYFQSFDFTAGVSIGTANRLELQAGDATRAFAVDREWRPLAFSRSGEIPASEVAFAGYGIVAPGRESQPALDAYADLDVRDRWALMFRHVPAGLDGPARQHLQHYASLRYKAMLARERGARGVLFVSGPTSQVRNELVALRFDASLAGTSMAALSLVDGVGDALLAGSGQTLEQLQSRLDAGEIVPGFVLENVELAASVDLQQERRTGRNVIGALRARRASGPPLLIGAHADHLGRGESSTSLARDSEKDQIHYGADDNASGVAALLEVAEWLADRVRSGELELERDILFAAWSGEELGLLGAHHFAALLRGEEQASNPHAAAPSDLSSEISAYLNMDMVGRLDGPLLLYGVGSSSVWPELIERANAKVGLPISLQQDAYLPTDSTTFYAKGVPILSAFTGPHGEYHTPRDRPELLDYDGMRDVARLIAALADELAGDPQSPDYIAAAPPSHGVPRAGLRVYLGTIPDYASSEVLGLRLSGVVTGGPAEVAGLREGDVIVAVDGRAIENIYDYTYALEALRVGKSASIGVLRGDQPLTLTILPTSRD